MDGRSMNQELERRVELKDVDASLTYGKIYTGKIWDILIGVIVLATLLMIIVATIGYVEEKELSVSIVMGYVMSGVLLISAILIGLYVCHGRRKGKLFLKDAIILKAKTSSLGKTSDFRFPALVVSAEAIRVIFYMGNKRIVKDSVYKGSRSYLHVFRKYADKEITIAYSPKYDEVLLIKSK